MIGMQYQIILPKDYNMGIIRDRVRNNGYKTDGFQGLYFKAYFITEAEKNGNMYNSYAPLYVWKDTSGMNEFIFGGFYDNILASFGWQHIHIGVLFSIHLDNDFHKSRYAVEHTGTIPESKSLANMPFQQNVKNTEKSLGNVCIYNPDKWSYSHFGFYDEKPIIDSGGYCKVYEVLYISSSPV
ncbi:MAG: DUF4865 family protein [Ectobacillus sp.]